MTIKVYGADSCHKTQQYLRFLKEHNKEFLFLDVEKNEESATELRSLYSNGKLNFPTITINTKKLRNPSDEKILRWIDKLK